MVTFFLGPIFVLNIFSRFLKFSSYKWNWDKEKLNNFSKILFLIDEIEQNTNFAKSPSAKWLFCKNIIQESKFCKIAELFFFVSFPLERGKFVRTRRNIYHKNRVFFLDDGQPNSCCFLPAAMLWCRVMSIWSWSFKLAGYKICLRLNIRIAYFLIYIVSAETILFSIWKL